MVDYVMFERHIARKEKSKWRVCGKLRPLEPEELIANFAALRAEQIKQKKAAKKLKKESDALDKKNKERQSVAPVTSAQAR